MTEPAVLPVRPAADDAVVVRMAAPPAATRPRRPRRRRFTTAWAVALPWVARVLVAAFVLLVAARAFEDGIELRRQAWRYTHTIRYVTDIGNGFRWGGMALDEAARVDDLQPDADGQIHFTLAHVRDGVVGLYDSILRTRSADDYDLDYPPLRLTVMTLWVRHVRETFPGLSRFPYQAVPRAVARSSAGPRPAAPPANAAAARNFARLFGGRGQPPPPLSAAGMGAVRWADEDVAAPLLALNAGCGAVAAVAAFFLTRLWVRRGDRDPLAEATGVEFRPRLPQGLLVFVAGTCACAYALPVAMQPVVSLEWWWWTTLGAVFLATLAAARGLPARHRGWACGLLAALLLWFDPAVIVDAHVWPQWDVWLLPAFLLAALAASLEWWLTCGAIVAVGAMAKGQLLLFAPLFLLWPLLAGRVGPAVRWASGFLLAAGVVLWPWIGAGGGDDAGRASTWVRRAMIAAAVSAALAVVSRFYVRGLRRRHVASTLGAAGVTPSAGPDPLGGADQSLSPEIATAPQDARSAPSRRSVRPWWRRPFALAAAAFAAILILGVVIDGLVLRAAWPSDAGERLSEATGFAGAHWGRWAVALLVGGIALPPLLTSWRKLPYYFAFVAAAAIWTASLLFHGNPSWLKIGFAYGTVRQNKTFLGQGSTASLPAILAERFGWNLHDAAVTIGAGPGAHDLELKALGAGVYGLCLLACGAAAALHARRRDPRLLAALCAPWAMFPNVVCQTGNRYFMWPAALSATFVALGGGMTLLHVLLTLVTAGTIAHQTMVRNPDRAPQLYAFFTRIYPGAGYMTLLISAIFLWTALSPRRPRRGEPEAL